MNFQQFTTAGYALFGATTITSWFPLLVPTLCLATISLADIWTRLAKMQKKAHANSQARD